MCRLTDRATSISTSTRSGPRPTSTRSASTSIGRCRIGATAKTISTISPAAPSTTSTISRAMSAAARPSISTTRRRRDRQRGERRAPGANPNADHRRRLRQAVGVQAEGHQGVVAERAFQPAGRRRGRLAHRLGAGVEADLVHRTRLPRGGQGLQPAERVHRSQELGELRAVLLAVVRDDLMQRRYIEALSSFFDPDDPDYIAGSNPVRRNTTRRWSMCRGSMCTPGTRDPIRPFLWRSRCGPTAAIGSSAIG